MLEITTEEQNTQKRMKRNEDSLKDLWDNIICITLQITEVSEEEKRKGLRKYLTRLVKNFLNMRKETATQVQEAETSLLKEINPVRKTLRHILIKLTKTEFKENIKSSKGTAKK